MGDLSEWSDQPIKNMSVMLIRMATLMMFKALMMVVMTVILTTTMLLIPLLLMMTMTKRVMTMCLS